MIKQTISLQSRGLAVITLAMASAIAAWAIPGSTALLPTLAAYTLKDDSVNDPAWKPSHTELAVLTVGKVGTVNNYCVNADGNLLVCIGGDRTEYSQDPNTGAARAKVVHNKGLVNVYSPAGKLVHSWAVPIAPQAICIDNHGAIYLGGGGAVVQLDPQGKVVRKGVIEGLPSKKNPGHDVTGIAVTGTDVFVACSSPADYGYGVFRLTKALGDSKRIISGLSGCCGQMDIQAHGQDLWVAHNALHRVERYSRTGKKLFAFGKEDRKAADGFGGCCEPKNLRLTSGDVVYTAESGPPTAIKMFNIHGVFLGVVAVPTFNTGCVRVTVDLSKDGKFVYILDPEEGKIHVFAKASQTARLTR